MSPCFADTFVFLAAASPTDRMYLAAIHAFKSNRRMMTTAWVLTEVADALCAAKSRGAFLRLLDHLRNDRRMTIFPPSEQLFDLGLDLYRRRPDKDWSLTDCISFVVMQERGITDALTGDHHFEQAGFVALLK